MASRDAQKTTSAICLDIAQVSLASVFIPYVIDVFNLPVAALGLATSFMFWLFAIRLARLL